MPVKKAGGPAPARSQSRGKLVATVDELFKAGLITPTGGNVSVRRPGGALITPSGRHKGSLRPEDLVEVNITGRPETPGARPSVETGMHLLIYRRRPDVNAVIHTHAPMATLLGLLDLPVPPVTLDAVRFTDLPSVPFAMPGSDELAEAVADRLAAAPAALLRNHGLLTVGADLRAAADAALALEEVAHLVVTCRLLGQEPSTIPPEAVEALKKLFIG